MTDSIYDDDYEQRSTHAHAAGHIAGSKTDQHDRPDATNGYPSVGIQGIGQPFTAPVHGSAPIHGMSTHHDRVQCPNCGVGILWNRQPVRFQCAGCKGVVDGARLPQP